MSLGLIHRLILTFCVLTTVMCDFSNTNIDFSQLNSSVGYLVAGASSDNNFGLKTATGDYNGDNIMDILTAVYSNGLYLVLGKRNPSANISVTNYTNSEGFKITASTTSMSPQMIDFIDDLNGDGKSEILIGLPNASPGGAVFVIFGRSGPFTDIDLDNLGSLGYRINGANSGDNFGYSVSGARDLNGDNKPDIIVGARLANNFKGYVYVIFGQSATSPSITVGSFPNAGGFRVEQSTGTTSSYFGSAVKSIGNFNNDTLSDFIVCGETGCHVIFGSSATPTNVDVSAFMPSQGFSIPFSGTGSLGYYSGSATFRTISYGDLNGDGCDDIFITNFVPNGFCTVYVIFGHTAPYSNVNLAITNSSTLIKITTSSSAINYGLGLSGANDYNGDSINDIIIGESNSGMFANGGYSIVYGNRSISDIVVTDMQPWQGYRNIGVQGSRMAISISPMGDLNQDGVQDFCVSAHSANRVYVLYGSKLPCT